MGIYIWVYMEYLHMGIYIWIYIYGYIYIRGYIYEEIRMGVTCRVADFRRYIYIYIYTREGTHIEFVKGYIYCGYVYIRGYVYIAVKMGG